MSVCTASSPVAFAWYDKCVCVCVCLCACVRVYKHVHREREREGVCVCVCVQPKARARLHGTFAFYEQNFQFFTHVHTVYV